MAVGLSFVVRGYAVYMMVVLFLIIIIILVPEWWGIGWYYRNLNKLLKYTATKTRNIYKRRAPLCRSDNFWLYCVCIECIGAMVNNLSMIYSNIIVSPYTQFTCYTNCFNIHRIYRRHHQHFEESVGTKAHNIYSSIHTYIGSIASIHWQEAKCCQSDGLWLYIGINKVCCTTHHHQHF